METNQISKNKKKRPRIDSKKEEQSKRDKVRKMMSADWGVWEIINKFKIQAAKHEQEMLGDPFKNPYKTESERIRKVSNMFRDNSIAEAFSEMYGLKLNPETGNEVPTDLTVGSLIEIYIKSISKEGVVFDSGNYKENFTTRNNIASYPKFQKVLPIEPVKALVIEKNLKHTVLDVFGPMVSDFVDPIVKNPINQYLVENYTPIKVKDLQLIRGGYLGKAVIPNVSDWLGGDYTIDAFIPGSHIVLNATEDFESWGGQDVDAFIMNYSKKPGTNQVTLVCSRKNYLKHEGNLYMMQKYNTWCDAGSKWEEFSRTKLNGEVTGVINSSSKCGVFVEIPSMNVTGMIKTPADTLVDYKIGDPICVYWTGFEEEMKYNDMVGQSQHKIPFEVTDGVLTDVNVKPIFELAL